MASAQLTPRQLEILIAVVAEMKPGEINWETVAPKANCSSAKYARDQFGAIRKLLQTASDTAQGDGSSGVSTPKTKTVKKTPAGKRKKPEANEDDVEETPTKKKKKAAPRKPKSATPIETKDAASSKTRSATPAAENGEGDVSGGGDVPVKAEPNEAGEMMDELLHGV